MAVEWFYKAFGEVTGPLSASELKDLARSGFITPDVEVRKGAEGTWVPASRVKGLFEEAAEPRPTLRPMQPGDYGSSEKAAPPPRPTPARPKAEQGKTAASQWYYKVFDEETGPVSSSELKDLAKSGFITPDVSVRQGTGGKWVPASRVKGLFAEAPKPAPKPKPPPEPEFLGLMPLDDEPSKPAAAPPQAPSRPAAAGAPKAAAPGDLGDLLDEAMAEPFPAAAPTFGEYPVSPVVPTAPAAPMAPVPTYDPRAQAWDRQYASSSIEAANKLAGEALGYAILGLFCCWPIFEPMAIVKAVNARRTLSQYPGAPGSGKALAALIIGWLAVGIGILGFIAQFASIGNEM
jgi:hypothetical protein